MTTDVDTYVGRVQAVAPDRLALQDDQGAELYSGALASVRRLEVAQGQRTYVPLGIAGGAALGLISGFVICSLGEVCTILSKNDIRPEVLVTSGLIGVLVGGLVGSRIRRDNWVDVAVEQLRVAFWPAGSGSVSVGFVLGLPL